MKQTILNLFNNNALLDKDCLKDGVKHIQYSILVDRKDIMWIDAAYIGTDGELYFMITDKDDEIKSVQYECMNISDIDNWYHSLTSKLNIQNMAANKNFTEKFIITKRIGDNDLFIEREFDDEQDAKDFVDLLRKSESTKYITYTVSQVLNY